MGVVRLLLAAGHPGSGFRHPGPDPRRGARGRGRSGRGADGLGGHRRHRGPAAPRTAQDRHRRGDAVLAARHRTEGGRAHSGPADPHGPGLRRGRPRGRPVRHGPPAAQGSSAAADLRVQNRSGRGERAPLRPRPADAGGGPDRRRSAAPRGKSHPDRPGPLLRRRRTGVGGRPHRRLGQRRERPCQGTEPHRTHESSFGRTALRRQRPHRPCVIGELTRISAGQHPGWAPLCLIT
ncbi:hypothetical protein SGPA1_31248 [Streptomyces misionensis JCM 4497]